MTHYRIIGLVGDRLAVTCTCATWSQDLAARSGVMDRAEAAFAAHERQAAVFLVEGL